MHRSGTSALVGSLQRHGLFLGAHNTHNKYNPRGNRENRPVLKLNEDVLRHSGGSWDAPPAGCSGAAGISSGRARSWPSTPARPLWGFKDPRTLLTLEGWQRLVPDLEFVGVFRHPARVARSLASRPELPVAGPGGRLARATTSACSSCIAGGRSRYCRSTTTPRCSEAEPRSRRRNARAGRRARRGAVLHAGPAPPGRGADGPAGRRGARSTRSCARSRSCEPARLLVSAIRRNRATARPRRRVTRPSQMRRVRTCAQVRRARRARRGRAPSGRASSAPSGASASTTV